MQAIVETKAFREAVGLIERVVSRAPPVLHSPIGRMLSSLHTSMIRRTALSRST